MTENQQFDLLSHLNSQPAILGTSQYFSESYLRQVYVEKISLSNSSGKDGIRASKFLTIMDSELANISSKIMSRKFRFTAYKERLILRGHKKSPRQISIPTIRDRIVLRSLCNLIHTTTRSSIGQAPHTLIDDITNYITNLPSGYCFIRIDVKDFYPSIPHDKLEFELNRADIDELAIEVCMNAVKTTTGSSKVTPTSGIPQGLSISNALAQIFMSRFDSRLSRRVPAYYRYVDDILCVCPAGIADDVFKTVKRSLKRHGLTAHSLGEAGKSEIRPVSNGIDFLGYTISTSMISVRKSSYDKMFHNMLKLFTDFKYKKRTEDQAFKTIYRINLRITGCVFGNKRRGWMMFFSRTKDMSQLKYLDKFIVAQCQKIGLARFDAYQIKSFLRSYHEIRFNLDKSTYIPNFNNFDRQQKVDAVFGLTKYERDDIEAWETAHLEQAFEKAVAREVIQLEQDVGTVS